jgi:hypothetical protein
MAERALEDAATLGGWRKSSYSNGQSGSCVEVAGARHNAAVPVRDSKDPRGPALLIPTAAWSSFIASLKG